MIKMIFSDTVHLILQANEKYTKTRCSNSAITLPPEDNTTSIGVPQIGRVSKLSTPFSKDKILREPSPLASEMQLFETVYNVHQNSINNFFDSKWTKLQTLHPSEKCPWFSTHLTDWRYLVPLQSYLPSSREVVQNQLLIFNVFEPPNFKE